MTKRKQIAYVKKLLALATSANQHEAELAAQEAQRAFVKFGLTDDDLDETVTSTIDELADDSRQELAHVVAVSKRCAALVNDKLQVAFRGRKGNVEDGKQLYLFLVNTVEAQCRNGCGARDPGRHFWELCYWSGFTSALRKRLNPIAVGPRWFPEKSEHPTTPPSETVMQRAELTFAQYFLPEDVRNAVETLRREAFGSGERLGQSITLPTTQETAKSRCLAIVITPV